jgi:hypothetical protein
LAGLVSTAADALSADTGSGSTPREGAGSMATVPAGVEQPEPVHENYRLSPGAVGAVDLGDFLCGRRNRCIGLQPGQRNAWM